MGVLWYNTCKNKKAHTRHELQEKGFIMIGEFEQGILDEFKRNELEKMKTNVENVSYYDYISQAIKSLSAYCDLCSEWSIHCEDCEFNKICHGYLYSNHPYDLWNY